MLLYLDLAIWVRVWVFYMCVGVCWVLRWTNDDNDDDGGASTARKCFCMRFRLGSRKCVCTRIYIDLFYFFETSFLCTRTRMRCQKLCTNASQTIVWEFSTIFVSFSRRALCKICNFHQFFTLGRPAANTKFLTRDVCEWDAYCAR